ncbi:MAG: hypothetical protein HOP12_06750 [Candidatus Eisenbacteria bacterium]|uniref:Uncharacterized protein n=1 Tax=Eiseniibacteriota bacterium TaxID=2212470 RepID=A0A849SEP9_UNCEI|nr:hypothetical protein [Candidatus Eisenbacteria bacterium]
MKRSLSVLLPLVVLTFAASIASAQVAPPTSSGGTLVIGAPQAGENAAAAPIANSRAFARQWASLVSRDSWVAQFRVATGLLPRRTSDLSRIQRSVGR